ncbi:MAG: TIGR02270 family protein [Pseudomonadota bacterium]|nr:TIGR02270 family protein [Pseudomonadota bacterium]
MIIAHIIEQHAEEAAFLWLLRTAAIHQPHYDLDDLAELDNRVEAHLDGLRIAGDDGWAIAKAALSLEEPGEVFTAAVLAFERTELEAIEPVLTTALTQAELTQALVSALGWLSVEHLKFALKPLLNTTSAQYRYLGIAAYALQRTDPGPHLEAAIVDESIPLCSRALRAVGELGRYDLLPKLQHYYHAEVEAIRFWAAWSAVLLGERQYALTVLKACSLPPAAVHLTALNLWLRCAQHHEAIQWLKHIAQNPKWTRLLIIAIGILGDPLFMPWVIQHMTHPQWARIAGETFSFITGVDLEEHDLTTEAPEDVELGPSEDPEDDNVALDADDDLPWPNPALVHAWWQQHHHHYQTKSRYLLGKTITLQHCQQILISGLQRQRHAAALELALMQPQQALFETRAVGSRQQRLLK